MVYASREIGGIAVGLHSPCSYCTLLPIFCPGIFVSKFDRMQVGEQHNRDDETFLLAALQCSRKLLRRSESAVVVRGSSGWVLVG